MLAYERRQQIKQILYEKKTVDVFYLSRIFSISETTIRRDLDKLEQEGFLKKTYGGAVLNEPENDTEAPLNYEEIAQKEISNKESLVAAIAASLVHDDEAIFLSGGSICKKMVPHLTHFSNLTVVTNDILIAGSLYSAPSIHVLLIGGQLVEGTSQTAGELARLCLENVLVNMAFLAVDGIDLTYGLTSSFLGLSLLYKKTFDITKEVVAVADSSKFGKTALSKIASITAVKKIVTNQDIDDTYKDFCFSNNIKLYTSFDIN